MKRKRAARHLDNVTRILSYCGVREGESYRERKHALLRSERHRLRWFRCASCAVLFSAVGVATTFMLLNLLTPVTAVGAFCAYLFFVLIVALTWEANNYIYPERTGIQLCYRALAALARCTEACEENKGKLRVSNSNWEARMISGLCQNAPQLVSRRSRSSNMPRLIEFNVGYSKNVTDRIEDSFCEFLASGNRKALDRCIHLTLGLLDVFMGKPAPGVVPQSVKDKEFAKKAILTGVRRRRAVIGSTWVMLVSVPVVVAGIQWSIDNGANWWGFAVRVLSIIVPSVLICISAFRRYVQSESLTFSDVGKTLVLSRNWQL